MFNAFSQFVHCFVGGKQSDLYKVVPQVVANTMLGICYTCEALCCSAHGCCAVEFGVACCCTAHSHCNPYTPPHQTGCTPVDRTTTTKHTNEFPNPWGPGRAPGHAQGITDRTYWGPSYMLGHTLSLYIPHSL